MLFFIILFFFYLCISPGVNYLHAELFFSNKESRLHLSNAAKLTLNSNINNFKGTLKVDNGSTIEGASILFDHGTLESEKQQSVLKGTFDPTIPNSILLQGNDLLHAEPGSIIQVVSISGNNNRIEGQPTFNTPLSLFDLSTSITLALQKKLNTDIELNGGLLFLDDDLRLGEGVIIKGPGTVQCNQSNIELWGSDGSWSSSLTFINPDAIELNRHLELSSVWTLSGEGNINGKGNVLDLSLGGKLMIANNAHIGLSNIKIRGLHTQNLLFMGPNAKIDLSDVQLELDGNYSTTLGGIFIDGPVTFLLKNYNFKVDNIASITFDGVRGFIDSLDFQNEIQAGQFQAPLPIFVDHAFVGTNLSANLTSGNLTILSSATIAESMGGGAGSIFMNTYITNSITNFYGGMSGTPTSSYLISSIITVTHVGLDDTFWVPVDQNIIIGTDVTLDASGNAMFFAHGDQPQMIVLPNQSLTLQNIELGRVNQNTFNIAPSSELRFGENVQLELNQNLTFSQGALSFTGSTNIVNVRGIGGNKVLTITPPRPGQPPVLNIGSNTMVLQDVELSGLSNINFSSNVVDGQVVTGAIALSGGARVNIDRDTNFNFIVEGTDNVIRILKNNVKLTGSLSFGNAVDNELIIDFILTEGLATENQVYFGDNFAYLFSELGKASLFFKDYAVRVINLGSNSFVMDRGSLLDGNNLFVGTFPIKQLSFEIGLSRGLLLTSDQNNAIDSSFARHFLQAPQQTRPMTAYELHKKRKETKKNESDWSFESNEESKEKDPRYENILKLFFENASHYTRALTTPLPITTPIGVGTTVQLTNASGTIQMDQGSSITKFGVDQSQALNIIMTNDCTIEQGPAVEIKSTDALYVLGRKNKIIINDDFIVNGNIYFDEGAELIIECATHLNNKFPKIQLGSGAQSFNLNLPQGSRLVVKGRGDLLVAPGSKIKSTALNAATPAELFFDDQIIAQLLGPGTLQFEGNFNFRLTHKAELFVGTDQHIIFGEMNTKRTKIEKEMNFFVDNARIRLDGTREARRGLLATQARISIGSANTSISFDNGAELLIGPSATFEVSTFNNEPILSRLQKFYFGFQTKLSLDETSNFILGVNDYTNKQYQTIDWDLEQTTIDAFGRFVYIGVPSARTTIYGVPLSIKVKKVATAGEIIKTYLNRNQSLSDLFYFLDIDGLFYIQNKDGSIVLDDSLNFVE